MIQFDNVTKRYPGGIDALKNLSFKVEKGEMVFLAGHSGAGKSTLLRLVAGIDRATSGTVLVNNQNLGKLGGTQLSFMRQHIGLVFQDHKILFDRSVFDNVMLPLDIIGFEPRQREDFLMAAQSPNGLIFLTGPTGSGKTTTLNAMLGLTSYEGSVQVLGEDPYRRRAHLMRNVAFISAFSSVTRSRGIVCSQRIASSDCHG